MEQDRMGKSLNYDLPECKHIWPQTGDKPWTCRLCGFSTANLRHIENGYCYHKWAVVVRGRLETCIRCGIVMNPRNVRTRCIGKVSVRLRNADIEDCSNPIGKLLEACERLLKIAEEISTMERAQSEWFFSKEGHLDAFLVAAALRERLMTEFSSE